MLNTTGEERTNYYGLQHLNTAVLILKQIYIYIFTHSRGLAKCDGWLGWIATQWNPCFGHSLPIINLCKFFTPASDDGISLRDSKSPQVSGCLLNTMAGPENAIVCLASARSPIIIIIIIIISNTPLSVFHTSFTRWFFTGVSPSLQDTSLYSGRS